MGLLLSPLFQDEAPIAVLALGPGRYTYRLRLERVDETYLLLDPALRTEPDAPSDTVEVRVENRGAVAFDAVAVVFPDAVVGSRRVDYGPVPPGAASAYAALPLAYRYATVEAVVGADTLLDRAIDYTGETPLPPGRFTYGLRAEEGVAYRDRTEIVREGDR